VNKFNTLVTAFQNDCFWQLADRNTSEKISTQIKDVNSHNVNER